MNRLVEYGSVEAIPFYNCSWKSHDEWMASGVRRPWLGYPIVVFGVCVELLYLPILYIIFTSRLIRIPCYKIMVLLAFTDMTATVCSCLITGPLLIVGAVFCAFPTFIYVAGGFAIATWCMSCSVTTSLFLNRVVSVAFHGQREGVEKTLAWCCICFCVCYGFYVLVFTPVVCFNSEWLIWLPEPLSEVSAASEEAADWYRNSVQAWNNWIFVTAMVNLFTLYYVLINKISMGQKSKAARSIFIQCSIICFFNTVIALVYNALTLITPSFWMLLLCQFCWSVNHGCPALIYITMNETIKKQFRRMIFGGKRRFSQSSVGMHRLSIVSRLSLSHSTTH